jgi:4a-hydroxytetrahydrobiopterin dehydratase
MGCDVALTDAELDDALAEHDGWRREGDTLVREITFRDFPDALRFVQDVGERAVDFQRRPDMCILENDRVRLTISNLHHAGLTLAEVRLAAKVNAILEER